MSQHILSHMPCMLIIIITIITYMHNERDRERGEQQSVYAYRVIACYSKGKGKKGLSMPKGTFVLVCYPMACHEKERKENVLPI